MKLKSTPHAMAHCHSLSRLCLRNVYSNHCAVRKLKPQRVIPQQIQYYVAVNKKTGWKLVFNGMLKKTPGECKKRYISRGKAFANSCRGSPIWLGDTSRALISLQTPTAFRGSHTP